MGWWLRESFLQQLMLYVGLEEKPKGEREEELSKLGKWVGGSKLSRVNEAARFVRETVSRPAELGYWAAVLSPFVSPLMQIHCSYVHENLPCGSQIQMMPLYLWCIRIS